MNRTHQPFDGQLVEQVLIALRRIVRSIDLHSHRLVKSCGLTGPQVVVMKEIARQGTPSPSDLVRAVKLSNATMTGILHRLESRALVSRRRSPRDRRRQLVSLTAAGERALAAAPGLLQDELGRTLGNLKDWERSLLLSSLQRLAEAMDAESLDAAPILSSGSLTMDEDRVLEILAEPDVKADDESAPEPAARASTPTPL